MATRKIQRERIQNLNEADVREGDYVLYWIQSSQRAEQNHALEYAVQRANDLSQCLLVVFGLTDVGPIAYRPPPRHMISRLPSWWATTLSPSIA